MVGMGCLDEAKLPIPSADLLNGKAVLDVFETAIWRFYAKFSGA